MQITRAYGPWNRKIGLRGGHHSGRIFRFHGPPARVISTIPLVVVNSPRGGMSASEAGCWECKLHGPTARGIGKFSLRGGHHSGLRSGLWPPLRPSWCPPLRENFPIPRASGPCNFHNSTEGGPIPIDLVISTTNGNGNTTGLRPVGLKILPRGHSGLHSGLLPPFQPSWPHGWIFYNANGQTKAFLWRSPVLQCQWCEEILIDGALGQLTSVQVLCWG